MRKQTTPLANSARACSECLALTELSRLGEPKCLYGEKEDLAGRVTLPCKKGDQVYPSGWAAFFVSHVNGSPSFVRKRRKCVLPQGSLGRRVSLLHLSWTSLLEIL